ncbi:hypothetical protein ACA910_008899 [Epithemia clementina (nom. ined.)]
MPHSTPQLPASGSPSSSTPITTTPSKTIQPSPPSKSSTPPPPPAPMAHHAITYSPYEPHNAASSSSAFRRPSPPSSAPGAPSTIPGLYSYSSYPFPGQALHHPNGSHSSAGLHHVGSSPPPPSRPLHGSHPHHPSQPAGRPITKLHSYHPSPHHHYHHQHPAALSLPPSAGSPPLHPYGYSHHGHEPSHPPHPHHGHHYHHYAPPPAQYSSWEGPMRITPERTAHLETFRGGACTCKKSRCLKLYCQCFASSTTCGPRCKCQGCQNTTEHGEEIESARQTILERNPAAFDEKFPVHSTRFVTTLPPPGVPHFHVHHNTTANYPPPRTPPPHVHHSYHYPVATISSASQQPQTMVAPTSSANIPVYTSNPTSSPTVPPPVVETTPLSNTAAVSPESASLTSTLSEDRSTQYGCKCRRSFCLKKYCECYQNSSYCSLQCRCTNCKNFPDGSTITNNTSDRSVATSDTAETSVSSSASCMITPAFANGSPQTSLPQVASAVHAFVRSVRQVSVSALPSTPEKQEHGDQGAGGLSSHPIGFGQVRNDASQSSTAEVRCPPPPRSLNAGSNAQIRQVSQEALLDSMDTKVTNLPTSQDESRGASESPSQDEPSNETREAEDRQNSHDSRSSGTDALAIMAAVAMTELVGRVSTSELEEGNSSSDSILGPKPVDSSQRSLSFRSPETPVQDDVTRQPKRKSSAEDDMRLPFKKRRTPSPRPTILVTLRSKSEDDTKDEERVQRMASTMTLESRNPSPIGPNSNHYYCTPSEAQGYPFSSPPLTAATPTRAFQYSHPTMTTAHTTTTPKKPTFQPPVQHVSRGEDYLYSFGCYQNCNQAHVHPNSYHHTSQQPPGEYTVASSFHRVTSQQTQPSSQPVATTPASYEEIMRSCGLPKSLSFRKICSKCGKTRSEHGELGFGNKCVFQECGKCLAGLHVHRKAGQPMGILCQLTVRQGAAPGASTLYERKIRELAARADMQREIQRRNKKKKQEADGEPVGPPTVDQHVVV